MEFDVYWSRFAVPDRGFEWINKAEPDPIFSPKTSHECPVIRPHPETTNVRMIDPFQTEPALYEVFRSVEPNEAGILKFANEYGWLGIGAMFCRGKEPIFRAEGLKVWQNEIADMAIAAWIFDRIGSIERATGLPKVRRQLDQDRRDLAEVIKWGDDRVRILVFIIGNEVLTATPSDPKARRSQANAAKKFGKSIDREIADNKSWPQFFLSGDRNPIPPARLVLLDMINEKLADTASPRMFFGTDGEFTGRLVPKNLLGLLWLQLYRVAVGETEVRICPVCRKWMDVTGRRKTYRKHPKCSKSERMKRYFEKRGVR